MVAPRFTTRVYEGRERIQIPLKAVIYQGVGSGPPICPLDSRILINNDWLYADVAFTTLERTQFATVIALGLIMWNMDFFVKAPLF